MAGKKKMPTGPHALSIAGEKRETRAQEAKESPAFQKAEGKMGLEKFDPARRKKKLAKKTSRGK